MAYWRRLKEDSTIRCGKTETPVSDEMVKMGFPKYFVAYALLSGDDKPRDNSYRCKKKATWINPSRCGCGECDMTFCLCDEHMAEWDNEHKG